MYNVYNTSGTKYFIWIFIYFGKNPVYVRAVFADFSTRP